MRGRPEAYDGAATALAATSGLSPAERKMVLDLVRTRAVRRNDWGVMAHFGEKDFGWREFDRWHAFFTGRSTFSPLWEAVRTIPAPDAPPIFLIAYRRKKFSLFLDWLQSMETARAAVAHYASRGVRAEVTRQGAGTACPICDLFNHREVTDGASGRPPFHPGCRCLVMAMARPKAVRPGGKGKASGRRS